MPKRIAPPVEGSVEHQDEQQGLSASERKALDRHETVIERGQRTFVEVGLALRAIRDGRLYREQDSTFDAYLRRRWGFSRQRAHQLITAAATVASTTVDTRTDAEWQERALNGLSPDERHRVCESARTMVAPGKKITATHLHRARALLLAPAPLAQSTPASAPPSGSERLTASFENTVYEAQGITLVRADARTVVPPLAPDAVIITDPPYNVGFDFGGEYRDTMPPEEYDELLRTTLRPPCIVLHRPEGICRLSRLHGIDPTAIVAWVYDGIYAHQWRAIAWFGLKPDLGGHGDWWNIQPLTAKRVEKTAHPCQTPYELVDRIIAVTPNLEFIADPFAGSGTTLAVAKSRKLRALGIEQSARFCEIAVQRLRAG
jgi:hypothetical protein